MDRKAIVPDELKPLAKSTPVAAAQKSCEPHPMGVNVMAPSVTTEDKATFTNESVSAR